MVRTKIIRLPAWARNLRDMMEKQGYNPRSLSLKAGLNATAVRDMLEGRTRFPRYDTVRALAQALDTTPALLMGEKEFVNEIVDGGFASDLGLLTEIIAKLQETVKSQKRHLPPRDFAAMAASVYKSVKSHENPSRRTHSILNQVTSLLEYQKHRQKKSEPQS